MSKFNVGDRVRMRGEIFKGTVTKLDGRLVVVNWAHGNAVAGYEGPIHYEHLKKISSKPKATEDFWIHTHACSYPRINKFPPPVAWSCPNGGCIGEIIHVRTVVPHAPLKGKKYQVIVTRQQIINAYNDLLTNQFAFYSILGESIPLSLEKPETYCEISGAKLGK